MRPITKLLLLLIISNAFTACQEGTDKASLNEGPKSNMPLIVGHRGFRSRAPENTLSAFKLAAESHADLIELDYHHTADGTPIVLHDLTLDRTTNVESAFGTHHAKVSRYTTNQIGELDAGSWFDEDFSGQMIPTLAESIAFIQDEGSRALIERKNGDAETCFQLIESMGLDTEIVVQAFDWDFLADLHQLDPNIIIAALGKGSLNDAQIEVLKQLDVKFVNWNYLDLDATKIHRLHSAGFQVMAYTVNKESDIKELYQKNVDGFITDNPERTRDILKRMIAATNN